MTIKQLKAILDQAPDEDRQVFIPGYEGDERNLDIGYNFDDLNDLDLYIICN